MSDDRHPCRSPLVPALIGGVVGAALSDISRQADNARLRTEIDQLANLERECLARENQRLQLAESESRRDEAERSYHHAVLWLSHCNNEERLDYLIARSQGTFTGHLAELLTIEASSHPPIASRLAERVDTRALLHRALQEHRAWQAEVAALHRRRWSAKGVCLMVGIVGLMGVILLHRFRMAPHLLSLVVLLMLLSPILARLQPAPSRTRAGGAPMPAKTFAGHLARHELVGTLRAAEIARIEQQLASQEKALRQMIAVRQSALLAGAGRHVWTLRPLIEAAQRDYPPRVRCDLPSITDETLLAHLLAETLKPALAIRLDGLLQT